MHPSIPTPGGPDVLAIEAAAEGGFERTDFIIADAEAIPTRRFVLVPADARNRIYLFRWLRWKYALPSHRMVTGSLYSLHLLHRLKLAFPQAMNARCLAWSSK
jgi:hypothetical protein